MKRCTKCGETKNLEEFYRDSKNKDGHAYKCKCCNNKYGKIWKSNNMKKRRAYARKRYKSHPEEFAAHSLKYRQNNPEKAREQRKKCSRNNPDKCRERTSRYRARKNNLLHTLTEEQWEETLKACNYKCVYCGVHQDRLDEALHQEHFIAVTKGGGVTINNILPACRLCNSMKHAIPPFEYIRTLPKAKERLVLLEDCNFSE